MSVAPFVSPYLKAPLRSLEEVMLERERRRQRPVKPIGFAARPAAAGAGGEGQKRGK